MQISSLIQQSWSAPDAADLPSQHVGNVCLRAAENRGNIVDRQDTVALYYFLHLGLPRGSVEKIAQNEMPPYRAGASGIRNRPGIRLCDSPNPGITDALCAGFMSHGASSRSILESPIKGLQPLNGIEQLDACLSHLVRMWAEPLGVLDRESDPINRHSCLVRHLEFECCWSRSDMVFDHVENLIHTI
jgi:hypothetical protein